MSDHLFRREDEDSETFAAFARLWGFIHDAELALERIAHGYGVNHTSKWARDTAAAAVTALHAAPASPSGDSDKDPGTPPDTSWNKRASPPGGEWQGIVIPEGWCLVPVEPTEEMCGAGMLLSMDGPLIAMSEAEEVYRAMLSAAPPREAVGVGIEGASRTDSNDARCDATAEASSRKSEGQP